MEDLCRALIATSGEVSGLSVARAILARYRDMDWQEKEAFFNVLTEEFDLDAQAVADCAVAYGSDPTREKLAQLFSASEPQRQAFLRRLNQVPGATAQLVAMRVDLLAFLAERPSFGRTDLDFIHLFTSWFNRGFLVLRRIDWDTPANILEKIIEYEAVHAIDDWDDLRRRIEPEDRHCFAFFHPVMPDEPLIFVEVALSKGIPASVQDVLAPERDVLGETKADTAVFYSISNCQRGLGGISFGNSLIKQVVEDLSRDLPNLKNFVTLSPIPGFNRWLDKQRRREPDGIAGVILTTIDAIADSDDVTALEALATELRILAAQYIVEEKRANGLPLDSVARFHLGNGALVHDVHAMADTSQNGLSQSSSVMVNYLYDRARLEQNHEAFQGNGTVAQSRTIQSLLKTAPGERRNRKTANG